MGPQKIKKCFSQPSILETRMLAKSTRMQHPKNRPAPGLSHTPALGRPLGALVPPGLFGTRHVAVAG